MRVGEFNNQTSPKKAELCQEIESLKKKSSLDLAQIGGKLALRVGYNTLQTDGTTKFDELCVEWGGTNVAGTSMFMMKISTHLEICSIKGLVFRGAPPPANA